MEDDLPSLKPTVSYELGFEDFDDFSPRSYRTQIKFARMGKSFPEKVFDVAAAIFVVLLIIGLLLHVAAFISNAFRPAASVALPRVERHICSCRETLTFGEFLTRNETEHTGAR